MVKEKKNKPVQRKKHVFRPRKKYAKYSNFICFIFFETIIANPDRDFIKKKINTC